MRWRRKRKRNEKNIMAAHGAENKNQSVASALGAEITAYEKPAAWRRRPRHQLWRNGENSIIVMKNIGGTVSTSNLA